MHLDIFELQGFPDLGILSLWGWKMSQELVEFSLRGRFLRCRFYTLVNKWSTAYLPPNISCTKQKANIYCPKILKILPGFFNSFESDIVTHSLNDELTVSLVSLASLVSLVLLVSLVSLVLSITCSACHAYMTCTTCMTCVYVFSGCLETKYVAQQCPSNKATFGKPIR